MSTPRDMVTILEKLERSEIVSAEASKEMIAVLKRCRDDNCIRRRRGGMTVANKTGALDDLRSDVGIVYSKGGRIAHGDYHSENAQSGLHAGQHRLLAYRRSGDDSSGRARASRLNSIQA